ncbi:MAG: hypothetical protein J0M15_10080 [Deltaproteobacteria bacterium]|nr:hypothetical protein [Deltaproteobacteria bacterium]
MKSARHIVSILFLLGSFAAMAADEVTESSILSDSVAATSEDSLAKFEISGSLDTKYSIIKSQKSSSLYRLQNFGQPAISDELSQFLLEPYLNGDYVTKDISFHIKTHSTYISEQTSTSELIELNGSVNALPTLTFTVGKKAFAWGKGYAFNPVGYVNPTKDSENPELAQAGLTSLSVDYTKSFDSGALSTLGVTFILVPSNKIQNRYGELSQTDLAGKAYFLVNDIDIDIMAYNSTTVGNHLGFDFSNNILTNLEVHGEFSQFTNAPKAIIDQNTLSIQNKDGNSYLFGLRYLDSSDTTVILEYYHNGNGLASDEFKQYLQYVDATLSSGQSAAIQTALSTSKNYFQKSALMRDYLYLKVSKPEPFNWVYFTPSLYVLHNLNDQSFSVGIPVSYKPFTNFEFILWPSFLVGSASTQFGDKILSQRLETWLRYSF